MLERIKNMSWQGRFTLVAVIVAVVCMAVYAYRHYDRPQKVTVETQQQAETKQGVQDAAENAHITVDNDQTIEILRDIKKARQNGAESVTEASVETYSQVAEEQQKKAGADFAIVTEEQEGSLAKAGKDTKVQLNQYNIKAYKKVIRTVDVVPQEKQVGFTVSRKITDDGQYIGVGVGYDWDDQKVVAKVSYSW